MFQTIHFLRGIPCTRALHQMIQRDTRLPVPKNLVFIKVPNVAPVLNCLNYTELEGALVRGSGGVVNATFVINATPENSKKMNKVRGIATFSEKIRDLRVLAVCDSGSHEAAMEAGATMCLDPADIGKIAEGEVRTLHFYALEVILPIVIYTA